MMRYFISAFMLLVLCVGHSDGAAERPPAPAAGSPSIRIFSAAEGKYVMSEKVVKSKEEWKQTLTPEQFHILREEGTERAFTGKLWNNHEHGVYRCAGCGLDLFRSESKYESGTGWPSFTQPIAPENIVVRADNKLFMRRTEVLCARCEGHLGHVFKDGPAPTGLRYCLNSPALEFVGDR